MSNLQRAIPPQELPDWMRRAQRGIDWGFLLVLALCLVVSAPFIIRTELPHNNANENYVYRTNDYSESFIEGWLYPRWSANVLGGYGVPIPSFYAPSPAYGAAVLQVLLTNNAVRAVRLLYVLATCIAGVSVYFLVLRQASAAAGILAAMLYVNSPYVSLVVPHVTGDLTSMLVLAFAPALLWATDRLIRGHQPQNVLLVAAFTCFLMLTSPKQAFGVYLLNLAYGVWCYQQVKKKRKLAQLFLAWGLGILLASFFWLPAILEQSAIHWQANIAAETLTLRLSDLITPLRAIDQTDMKPHAQLTIGVVTLVFALGGALARPLISNRFGSGTFFLINGLVITCCGLLIFPHETWILGLMALYFAVVGSDILLLRKILSSRMQRLLLPVLMVGIWIGSRASWQPPEATHPFGSADSAEQINYEQQGYGVAVLPAGESLPSTLPGKVDYNRNLIESFKSGDINKLGPGQITGKFRGSPLDHFTHGDRFQVRQVSDATSLIYLTSFFPGWRATIGDQPVNLRPESGTGLIQIDLPEMNRGNSELLIVLGSTNVRLGSWLISAVALLIVVIWTWSKVRTLRKNPLEDFDLLKSEEARLIALPIGCFALVALVVLVPNPFFKINLSPSSGMNDSFKTGMRSNTGLTLSAFRLADNSYRSGDDFSITLFWQTQRFLSENYQVKLFLVNNSDGSTWNETELRNPGYYPTKRWNTSQYISDVYDLPLAQDVTSGNYQIHVQAYNCSISCDDSSRIEFFNPDGQPLGTDVILPTLITISP